MSLSMLRGSHSIAQISDAVIALERDQQAEDPEHYKGIDMIPIENSISQIQILIRIFFRKKDLLLSILKLYLFLIRNLLNTFYTYTNHSRLVLITLLR